jgi:chromosome segregation protein
MHIKRLEIVGFKSFVDRTVIHFDHDVIGVVGPNGCGKSNVVDAIRWCMGEQSARHLRGKSMEDVIFNGSETRSAHGMAEVTLTFDNSDPSQAASLPLEYRDYPEIAITRRLFREDGTSQYLVNKVEVRLKDVVDIFLGTGVGTKAYSIVEQGKIGQIVSARPEDRRALIEEAAGITKYKSRKKASERKIELTEQNLLRVGDHVSELERSVASLQRQAAKAERYLTYRHELETLTLHAASHQLLEIIACGKFAAEQRAESEIGLQQSRTELDGAEAALEVERASVLEQESSTEHARNASWSANNEVRALEAEINRETDRLADLDRRIATAREEQTDVRSKAEKLEAEHRDILESLSSLKEEEAREASSSLTENERLESLRAGELQARGVLDELRTRASAAASQVATAKEKRAGLERRTSEMQARRLKLNQEQESLSLQRTELLGRCAELAEQVDGLDALRAGAAEERAALERQLGELRDSLAQSDRQIESDRSTLEKHKARLHALAGMCDRLEGVTDGVKGLMAKNDPALLGLVVDRVRVPAALTGALTALLGESLECVVVSDNQRAVSLLSELASESGGRATVIGQWPRRVAGKGRETIEGEGVIGPLVDQLAFAPEDEALINALIDDAVLVQSGAVALDLAPRAGGRPLVALDGTVVFPDGRISGGSAERVVSNLVDVRREMHELEGTCGEMTAHFDQLVDAHQQLRIRMTEVGSALDDARQRAHEAELTLMSAEKDKTLSNGQIASIERRIEEVLAELTETDQALSEAEHEHAAASAALELGESVVRETEAGLDEACNVAARWQEQANQQLAVVTERKICLTRVREQVGSAQATADRLGRSASELAMRSGRLEQELVQAAAQMGETAGLLVRTKETLQDAVQLAQIAEAAAADASAKLDEARAAQGLRETALKTLRSNLSLATERLASHEVALEKLAMQKEHLIGGIQEKFRGLDLLRVVGDYHLLPSPDENHRQRMTDLDRLIERMGGVNLDATREHAEEKQRLVFFTEQKADLEKALGDLKHAIAEMNRESKRLFRETFHAVNSRFKELFPRMFNGGRAELQLTNPDDLLETGVEIIAQPPGKKLGNIELMSGGEKALTAVSLIFAIFQYKPSPFCVLDEVDAPLDEANVARYNELIRSMTDRSQFIVITHVRKTMQSVDILYGVTMQEAGISRLVSVKVNETAQHRSSMPSAARATEQVQVA